MKPVIDQIIRTRRRTIALIIQPDGQLVVRAPLNASHRQIQTAVAQRADWILKTQEIMRSRQAARPPVRFENGASFWYFGKTFPLEIVEPTRPALNLTHSFQLSEKMLPRATEVFTAWYRAQALHYLPERVQQHALTNNFTYNSVRITSARTRWGSCSGRNTLSFPWRLIMAPPDVIDYVILHELAHTREHNHSARFWALVASLDPEYPSHRKWLKLKGPLLTLDD